jgi:hypothetical protein
MTETTTPATDIETLRAEARARFTADYVAANRLQFNDAGEQDDPTQVGAWYVELDRTVAEGKGCACGCGLQVTNAKRNFLPGHDQRLMGILVRAERENLEVSWIEGGMLVTGQGALDYGRMVLTDSGIEKLERYLAETPKRTRRAKAAAVTAPEVTAEAPKADPLPAKVKVGRWEYDVVGVERDGNGTVIRVTYRNARQEEVTVSSWGKLA